MAILSRELIEKLDTKLLILDVDGVLTNGIVYYFDNGVEGKGFHIQDGLGMQALMKMGIEVAIISGKPSVATRNRLESLGIVNIYLGVGNNKIKYYHELREKLGLRDENIAYVGDDLPDLPPMELAGFSIAVANAVAAVKAVADYITRLPGGAGAVREVCDLWLCKR